MRYISGINGTNIFISTEEYKAILYIKARGEIYLYSLPEYEKGIVESLLKRGVVNYEVTDHGTKVFVKKKIKEL